MTLHTKKLDAALDELRRQVEAVVREEQLRDQLTGLGNAHALSETLKNALDSDGTFWLAFVEVDYFKRINDKYGYQLADGLLQKIAKRLGTFDDYLPGTIPIRAHGDEFYLFGRITPALNDHELHEALDRVRSEIAGISVMTAQGAMRATVSVGWMTSTDGGDEVLTERAVMHRVEAAVSAAKVSGRNRVVRYSPEVEKAQRRSIRDDCSNCRASFTVEVPVDSPHTGSLYCPNCGKPRARLLCDDRCHEER